MLICSNCTLVKLVYYYSLLSLSMTSWVLCDFTLPVRAAVWIWGIHIASIIVFCGPVRNCRWICTWGCWAIFGNATATYIGHGLSSSATSKIFYRLLQNYYIYITQIKPSYILIYVKMNIIRYQMFILFRASLVSSAVFSSMSRWELKANSFKNLSYQLY